MKKFNPYFEQELTKTKSALLEFIDADNELDIDPNTIAHDFELNLLVRSFAFLASTLHGDLDKKLRLLEKKVLGALAVSSQWHNPTMAIVQTQPPADYRGSLPLPSGELVTAKMKSDDSFTVPFKACWDVHLQNIRVTEVIFNKRSSLSGRGSEVTSFLSIKLQCLNGTFADLLPLELDFFIQNTSVLADDLVYLLANHLKQVRLYSAERNELDCFASSLCTPIEPAKKMPLPSLLNQQNQRFQVLFTYFSLPDIYRYFTLHLSAAEKSMHALSSCYLEFELNHVDQDFSALDSSDFLLNTYAVANLRPVKGKPMPIDPFEQEYHLLPDTVSGNGRDAVPRIVSVDSVRIVSSNPVSGNKGREAESIVLSPSEYQLYSRVEPHGDLVYSIQLARAISAKGADYFLDVEMTCIDVLPEALNQRDDWLFSSPLFNSQCVTKCITPVSYVDMGAVDFHYLEQKHLHEDEHFGNLLTLPYFKAVWRSCLAQYPASSKVYKSNIAMCDAVLSMHYSLSYQTRNAQKFPCYWLEVTYCDSLLQSDGAAYLFLRVFSELYRSLLPMGCSIEFKFIASGTGRVLACD